MGYFSLQPGNAVLSRYEHSSDLYPSLTNDGAFILTPRHFIMPGKNADLTANIAREGGGSKIAATVAGWPAYLEKIDGKATRIYGGSSSSRVNRGIPNMPPSETKTIEDSFKGFRMRSIPAMSVIADIPVENTLESPTSSSFSDKFMPLYVSAYSDRLVYINKKEKTLYLYPLGLIGKKDGGDSAKPGTRFERKLNIAAGAAVNVESGPPGLVYNADTKNLTWNVPADFKPTQVVQVILLIKGADAKTEYKIEKITIP